MLLSSLAFLIYASASALAQSQTPIVYDVAHNATPIGGTWSSGSRNVTTGGHYVNVNNQSFAFPTNTGISFSFIEGVQTWFEVLRFRMNGNGSAPNCPTTVLNWSHGLVTFLPNGSLILTPVGDGYQQVQNPCAATSNFIEAYNVTEFYQGWNIFTDPLLGPQLYMYQFDGTPYPPQGFLSSTPNMLPTQRLRNPPEPTTSIIKRSTNVAPPIHSWSIAALSIVGVVLGSALLL